MRPTCFSTLGCAELDWDGVAALARAHGLAQVELRALADRLDLPVYLAESHGSPDAFARRVRADGLAVPVFDTGFTLTASEAKAREDLLASVPWAEALGARWLRVFDGGKFDADAPDCVFDVARENLAWWRELRARYGWRVDLAVETHDSLCSSRLIERFQRGLTTPVAIIWDTWHIWFKNHEPVAETCARLAPWTVHVHFKDGLREPVLQYPYRYVRPGTGEFPLADLDRALAAHGYAGARCLEWERKWHPYLPPLDEALTACTSPAASSVDYSAHGRRTAS